MRNAPGPFLSTRSLALGLLLGIGIGVGIIPSHAKPPELTAVQPLGLIPGATNQFVLTGNHLEEVHTLWTTWSGPITREGPQPWSVSSGQVTIPIPVRRQQPPGVEMIRLVGPHGISNPLLLLIDGLPRHVPSGDRDDFEHAPLIPAVAAVDATCADLKSGWYKVTLGERQRLSLEIVANRLGSMMDPVLRVLDPQGQELVYVNETPTLGADCAVEFQAPAEGEYRIEVRDAEFGGGTDYRYRLRLGVFPVAIVPGAGGLSPDHAPDVRIPWQSAISARQGEARGLVRHPPQTASRVATARLRLRGRHQAETLTPRLAILGHAEQSEIEPNEAAATANPMATPVAIQGGFDSEGDRDWYRMSVTEPGRWKFRVLSRSLGFAADPLLTVVDEQGRRMASAGMEDLDPWIDHAFKEPGVYFVTMEDAAGRHGVEFRYLLHAERDSPGFEISTETDRLNLTTGTTGTLKLTVTRRGYDGPIRVALTEPESGFVLENPVIGAGKKEWDLQVRCHPDARPGTWMRAELQGRPEAPEMKGVASLQLQPAMRKAFPKLLVVPPGFADGVWLTATAAAAQAAGGGEGSAP